MYLPDNFNDNGSHEQAPPHNHGEDLSARRQSVIDNFYLRMKWERKSWSIFSAYYFAMAGAYCVLASLYMILGFSSVDIVDIMLYVYTFIYFFTAVCYFVFGMISHVMKNKLSKYMDGLYYDCGPSVKRGTSVGMIVFCAFFNGVGLVFYIINFVHGKNHRDDFEEIRRLQYNAASVNN